MNRSEYFLTLVLASLAACETEEVGRSTYDRDTLPSGRIVTANRFPGVSGHAPRWQLELDFVVGGADPGLPPEEQFGRVIAIALDSNAHLFVFDVQARTIRVFDDQGAYTRSIGRPGSGPGEFQSATSMIVTRRDTVIVKDEAAGRFSFFDSNGRFLESYPREIGGSNPWVGSAWLGDGYLDWMAVSPDGWTGERLELTPVLFDAAFGQADTLSPIRHTLQVLEEVEMPMTVHVGLPVGTVDQEGTIWFANSGEYAVHRRSLEGDTLQTFTLDVAARPVSQVEEDGVRERFAWNENVARAVLEALPDSLPVIRAITVDPRGHVVVVPDVAGVEPGRAIDIFDETGVFQGRVLLPPDAPSISSTTDRLLRVTDEHLIYLARDKLGTASVVRLSIGRK